MIKKMIHRWRRANRKFNRAFAMAQRLSKWQEKLSAVMQTANDELHRINEELDQYD